MKFISMISPNNTPKQIFSMVQLFAGIYEIEEFISIKEEFCVYFIFLYFFCCWSIKKLFGNDRVWVAFLFITSIYHLIHWCFWLHREIFFFILLFVVVVYFKSGSSLGIFALRQIKVIPFVLFCTLWNSCYHK